MRSGRLPEALSGSRPRGEFVRRAAANHETDPALVELHFCHTYLQAIQSLPEVFLPHAGQSKILAEILAEISGWNRSHLLFRPKIALLAGGFRMRTSPVLVFPLCCGCHLMPSHR